MQKLMLGLLFLACMSCSKPSPSDVAGQAAKAYYDLLLEEKYDDFVLGTEGCDSLPADYHEQMVANAMMFMGQQKAEHKGIASFALSRCVADTATHSAQAFLTINYADSTHETIVVQMVEHDGVWRMK